MKNLFLTLILAISIIQLHAQHTEEYAAGEILIQLKGNKSLSNIALLSDFSSENLQQKKELSNHMQIFHYRFDNTVDHKLLLERIRQHPAVALAQFNHKIQRRTSTEELFPNDPLFDNLWGLHNTGQTGGVPDADIDAPEAWEITQGGTTILGDTLVCAIVDGGVAILHEDLQDNLWKNYAEIPDNGVDDDNNGYIDDYHGWNAYNHSGSIPGDSHGTHVAGTVSARGDNNIGVVGVNWYAQVMPIAASSTFEATVMEGYGYILEMRKKYNDTDGNEGAFVVTTNSSFGVNQGNPNNYPLWGAMYDSLGKQGILSAAATANASWNIDEVGDVPTAMASPYMISVTNTTDEDTKANAGYGVRTIDLGAPGSSVYSTTPNDNYGYKSGTSMATPHVAGALTLMFAAADSALMEAYKTHPDSIALLMRDYLLFNTDPIEALEGITVTGGRLNVHKAILAMDTIPIGPKLFHNPDTIHLELATNSIDSVQLFLENTGGGTINYELVVADSTSWITFAKNTGTLYAQETDSVEVIFESADLPAGAYVGYIQIHTPDTTWIPVYLTVTSGVATSDIANIKTDNLKALPNPFHDKITFVVETAESTHTTLQIYNLSGERVITLLDNQVDGKATVVWNGIQSGGKKLPPGMYLARLINSQNILTKKIIIQ